MDNREIITLQGRTINKATKTDLPLDPKLVALLLATNTPLELANKINAFLRVLAKLE